MSHGPTRVDECLQHLHIRVTPAMNVQLLRQFTEEEVNVALAQMHPLKSSGPDSYSAVFYQKAWGIVGDQVRYTILDYLNGSQFDPALNSTSIVLIPKFQAPSKVTDFRPISLCNVLYKLIAKVLANSLKIILPLIISLEQSAFIRGV
jgi:hypothetical protein